MSKTHKEKAGSRQTAGESPLIPERYQHLVAVAILFLSLVLFFTAKKVGGNQAGVISSGMRHTFNFIVKTCLYYP